MMGLSDSERILMIRSAILIQYPHVTDRRTDGRTELAWHIRAIAYMLSRVKRDRQIVGEWPETAVKGTTCYESTTTTTSVMVRAMP